MAQDVKMYVAVGLLAALGVGYYVQQKSSKEEAAEHTVDGVKAELPDLNLSEEATAKITKIVIDKPATTEGEEEKPAEKFVLVKQGDKWMIEEPVSALANQQNVESLIKNLNKLSATEEIATGKDSYAKFDLIEGKALHSTFFEGDKVVREIWAGKSGGRGQMARVNGSDSVFSIDGYSSFLYNRNAKGWRDLSILEVDTEEVSAITIKNENGEFSFEKEGEGEEASWDGKFSAPKAVGSKKIEDFDAKKVTELLNAYKKLNASGFGDGKTLVETGLEQPVAVLSMQQGDKTIEVSFGNTAEGTSRYAKVAGNDQIYTVSSWAADWGTADEKKFQPSEEPPPSPGGPPGGMPPGMGMPSGMGMPPGHP